MMRFACSFFAAFFVLCTTAPARAQPVESVQSNSYDNIEEPVDDVETVDDDERSWGKAIVLYFPNRFLDLFDIIRARVRLGPGVAVGVRVTEPASVYLGSYATIYAGLPGPRGRKLPRLPVGLETQSGASISVADATINGGFGPDYSPTEIEASLHAAVVGVDVGIDPVEIADFFAGIVGVDFQDDDY